MILTGVFAEEVGLIHGDATIFVRHIIALTGVVVGVFALSYAIYVAVNQIIPMRVRTDQEQRGLDYSQHGERVNS